MWLYVSIVAIILIIVLLVFLKKKNDELYSLNNNINSLKDKQEKQILELTTENKKYSQFFQLSNLYHDNQPPQKQFLEDIIKILNTEDNERTKKIILLKNRIAFLESAQSNLTAIPYMAQIMADYETYGIQHLANELNWGRDVRRLKKVKSINEIREEAQEIAEQNREAQYQLAYLLELFPALQEVIDCEFSQLPIIEVSELSNYDHALDYLSKEEYDSLSNTERNQLA